MPGTLAQVTCQFVKMPIPRDILFLERLAAHSINKAALQVIVHSENLTEELKDRAFTAGEYAVVPKPCEFKELFSVEEGAIAGSPNF